MRYLVTGGCGFMGSNIAHHILSESKGELLIIDNLSREGAAINLEWLKKFGDFKFKQLDICQAELIEAAFIEFHPDVVFHLAGQVAMTTSLKEPKSDFMINAAGTLNVLEAIKKHTPDAIVIYSSTNKVYGNLNSFEYQEDYLRYTIKDFPQGFDETLPLNFSTPYGCSKGSADQYVVDYNKTFGLHTVVFRHSSAFGNRQFSTYDQGWVNWFIRQAVETAGNPKRTPFTISGSGKQVRDILFSRDLISCYFKAVEHIDKATGEVFNIGGGVGNALSILELLIFLEEELAVKLDYQHIESRENDQLVFVSDIQKARRILNWFPTVNVHQGIREVLTWIKT